MTKTELIARLKALEAKADAAARQSPDGPARPAARTNAHESEARLRAILQTAVEGIITIDERGIIESINPAAQDMFGYRAGELIGRNVTLLMPSPHREQHDAYIANYLRTGKAKIIGIGRETVGQRKDGTVFPIDLAVSEVRLAGRRLFTGFVRDITERKRLEEEILEISDQQQRRFGQDLHDGLGQHLAGIELMSQVLEQKLEGKSKAAAARATEITRHVREAISQARLLARGLSPVAVESAGLMSALQELAAGTEKLFKVQCRFRCKKPVLVEDNAAATHLYRIAQEAVHNAVKHGMARHIELALTRAAGRVSLSIKDDGVGFAPVPKGKGMGLRTMHYRAGMIGGTITISKPRGGGTAVICTLPETAAKTRVGKRHDR